MTSSPSLVSTLAYFPPTISRPGANLLNKLIRIESALDDLSSLLHCAVEGVNNDDTSLNSVLMKVPMSVLMPLHSLVYNLQRNFQHLLPVAPDRDDQAAFPPALTARKDGMIEQRLRARRAAKDDVGRAHLLLDQSRELTVPGSQDPEIGIGPALASFLLGRDGVETLEELPGGLGEAVVDDVHVADGGAAEHEREAHMPVGLLSGTEDGECMHPVSLDDQAGGGESGAEGG